MVGWGEVVGVCKVIFVSNPTAILRLCVVVTILCLNSLESLQMIYKLQTDSTFNPH